MGITEFLAEHITAAIGQTGYISIFILMIMESMVFPVPSEAVMPFAGFLIAEGQFSFAGVFAASTAGSIIGSLVSYWMGYHGGDPFVRKFGKYLLLNEEDLDSTEKFFTKYGQITIFVSRFIPVVRHLISIPAGIGRMNLARFSIYTIIGAGIWNMFLAVVGYYFKKNWSIVMKYSHTIDIVVVVILVAAFLFFAGHHIRRKKKNSAKA